MASPQAQVPATGAGVADDRDQPSIATGAAWQEQFPQPEPEPEVSATALRRSHRKHVEPKRFDFGEEIVTQAAVKINISNKGIQKGTASMIVERSIKLVTEQHTIDKPAQVEGFPMKEWTIEVYILDEAGKEKPAKCFTKVVYNLHPSFENPTQTFLQPPFKCTNEGWGEFEMTLDCYTTEKGGKQSILHDLNFAKATYENIHQVQFKNPSQALQAILRETGPLPSDEERKARKPQDGAVKKKKPFDVEKMADAIGKLGENELMYIIQLIHDHKDEGTYIINNVDAGEFSVDLYTVPDALGKLLWDYLLTTSEGHRLR